MSQQTAVSETIISILEAELPSFFDRATAVEKCNGLFTRGTLAQLEHVKLGPPTHGMGRKVFYAKDEFIAWLREYYGGMDVQFNGFVRTVRKRPAGKAGSRKASEGNTEWQGEGPAGPDSAGDVS